MSEQQQPLVTLTIDGSVVSVPKGTTVYNAAKQLQIDIPIFCYHDRMPPFGACRMCLVEVEKMNKLQASCTLEVQEGMVVKTKSQQAIEGRNGIIELLLINHPLDCPICDRGGECPLQENALEHGPGESRFFEEKRHFDKRLPLGPVLMLDRERCIVCARCTRFGDIISGDHALEFIDRGFKTEVGTPDGEPAHSKFIGNTIMICPVGALTSQVYRFRARPWDNEPSNSSCTLCPVGCSMVFDSRDGEIMRTRSRENRDVNDIWLCDKGWFGYEFTSSPERLQQPLIRKNGTLEPCSWDEALSLVAQKMQEAKPSGKIAGFGGNPLTTEENYLFQKLIREGTGSNHVDHRIGSGTIKLDDEGLSAGMEISPGDCENLSYVLLLGIDLTEEFPLIWLRLKQAINHGAKVFFMGNFAPEIATCLAGTILHAPGKELEMLQKQLPLMTEALQSGKKGALFVGRQYLSNVRRKEILSQLMKFRKENSNIALNIMEGRGNSYGARIAGMRPDLGPLGQRLNQPGYEAKEILENAASTGWNFLYVAGSNPAKCFPSHLWKSARSKIGFMVVQDLFLTETANEADVILPTLSFVEKGGSFINIEGRVQILGPGKEIPENLFSDGEIFTRIAQKLNLSLTIEPSFLEALKAQKIPLIRPEAIGVTQKQEIQQQKEGSLSACFTYALFDEGVRMKHNPRLLQLAQKPGVRLNPIDARKRGLNDGDKVRISANSNSISAAVQIDKRVAEGVAVLPIGFDDVPIYELSANLINGLPIDIRKE